jgi:hypothetical protein
MRRVGKRWAIRSEKATANRSVMATRSEKATANGSLSGTGSEKASVHSPTT